MVDESFHLTALDARRYDFGSALRGYDKIRVDQFREQVADELERLTRVAQDLESKAKGFHEQLRAFRDRDKALNEALVSAQQLRGEIRDQADREAQLVVREARAQADRMLDEARAEIRRLQADVDALERMRRNHIAQLRALAQRQLTEIEAIDEADRSATVTEDAQASAAGATPAGAPKSQPSGMSPMLSTSVTPAPSPGLGHAPDTAATQASSGVAGTTPTSTAAIGGAASQDEQSGKREDRKSAARTMTPLWLDASVPE